MAARNSSQLRAFEIPTEEPKFAGFTNIGYPHGAHSRGRSSPRRSVMYSATGNPRSFASRFITSLSIATDDPSTPAPT